MSKVTDIRMFVPRGDSITDRSNWIQLYIDEKDKRRMIKRMNYLKSLPINVALITIKYRK